MISSIAIKHFESHKDTYIELHSGLTVLVGESDEGKSSIIRAFKWNIKNRPQGDSYRNNKLDPKKKEDKLKETEVTIDYTPGVVSRVRNGFTSGINEYIVNEQEPLRALRSDVPDEVKEISRMKSVNIQSQHPNEQYFLLADKPGQVAKQFNKVSGLVIMDKAIADINSQVRSCNSKIKMAENEIKDRSEELEETKWVDTAQNIANNLKGLKKRIYKKTEAFEKLRSYLSRIKELHWTMTKSFHRLDEAKNTLKELKADKQSIEQKKYDINTLSELILSTNNVDAQLNVYADTQEALKLLNELISLNAKIFQYHGESDSIDMLLTEIDANKEDMISAENDLIDAKTDYDAIWKEQSCPTCGRSESV